MAFIQSNMGGGLSPDDITITSPDQILNGYKDYDSNGDLITGSNLGYDAGVTQGHTDRDTGVTVTSGSQVISGYKARTSDGTLVDGTDAGYSAGVTQGHTDRDTGVTVTAAGHILSGYKGRNSSGTLLTGTAVNPSGAKSITSNGNGQDVKAYATVNVSVPNSNSGTYTPTEYSSSIDMGATNSYRYINTKGVPSVVFKELYFVGPGSGHYQRTLNITETGAYYIFATPWGFRTSDNSWTIKQGSTLFYSGTDAWYEGVHTITTNTSFTIDANASGVVIIACRIRMS